jgi:TPR repeat protein
MKDISCSIAGEQQTPTFENRTVLLQPDLPQSKTLLGQAIFPEDVNSMRRLASMYLNGHLCDPDMTQAKMLYEQAIALGDADSMRSLAVMYKDGLLGSPDMTQAKTLLERAIALGHADSMRSLAFMYKKGQLGDPDIAQAKTLLEQAIAVGHTRSMFSLAFMYQNGKVGDPDMTQAKMLYEKAIVLGDADSMFNLALMYKNGLLGDPDMTQAKALLEQAVALGDGDSMRSLAIMHKNGLLGDPDITQAKTLFERAIALGHPDSMFSLALMYSKGQLGDPDIMQAKMLYEQAIDLGHAGSMFNLAALYQSGQLGDPDMMQAKMLYEKAIALGDADSMFNLALMYQNGQLGDPDMTQAKALLEQAVALGDGDSMCSLALMYQNGEVGDPDMTQAKTLLEQAIALGHAGSMFSLALMYKNGQLGEPDRMQEKNYYEQASALNHPGAMFNLGLMYRNGVFGVKNYKKANSLFAAAKSYGHLRASSFLSNPMIAEVIKAIIVQNLDNAIVDEIESTLESLEEVFFDQRKNHIVKHPSKLAHFTTWPAIESILSLNNSNISHTCLRQYHVDYMNDPSEGKRLLKFRPTENIDKYTEAIEASIRLKNLFDEHYFKSFEKHSATAQLLPSVFTVSLTKESDRLDLWRAYGRDGHGYCLILATEQNNFEDKIVNIRDRRTSHEFLSEETDPALDSGNAVDVPLLYWIKYGDEEVAQTLNKLKNPLVKIFELKEKVPEKIWNQIASCSTAILLELLYLFKDEQYSTEKEARALTVMNLGNPRIKIDERSPGFLYCETPPFLFKTKDSEIVLGPKVPTPSASLWNIRFRLSKLGLADKVVVRKSCVPYR